MRLIVSGGDGDQSYIPCELEVLKSKPHRDTKLVEIKTGPHAGERALLTSRYIERIDAQLKENGVAAVILNIIRAPGSPLRLNPGNLDPVAMVVVELVDGKSTRPVPF